MVMEPDECSLLYVLVRRFVPALAMHKTRYITYILLISQ